MKPLSSLFALATLSIIFSCHRPDDPPPAPCAGVTADTSPLKLKWSTLGTGSANFANSFPIVWNDKVLCARNFGIQWSISCYDGASGSLIWEVPVEGIILENNLKLSGDKLYWANDRVLWSLDLNTATAAKVCEFGQGHLSRNFALWNDMAFCFLTICSPPPCDTLAMAAYRVNLVTGTFHEEFREVKFPSYNQFYFLQDPVISTNSDGDTLFCFMGSDFLFPSTDYLIRFVCRNLTRSTTTYSSSARWYFYYFEEGNLSVHDGKAYVPIGDTVYCFSTENGAALWKHHLPQALLTVKEGYLIASPDRYDVANLDLDDGHIIWRRILGPYEIALFQPAIVRNGHLYFIGTSALCALDLSNGCVINKRYAPSTPPNDGLLSNGLALSGDGKLMYLRHFPNLIAAEFSD